MINFTRLYFFLFVLFSQSISSGGRIVLNNNGYDGIQIVISNAVPEDPALISRIQEVFTNASRYLFTATRNRAFFRQIDIIVPKTWVNVTFNSTVASIDTSTEYILVDNADCSFGNSPYTRGNLECGKPAWYTHLTPDFFTNSNGDFGDEDKVIVHEWGHLRFGLFDEYASLIDKSVEGERRYKHFYPNNGQNRPVACSRNITGVAYKLGEVQTDSCNLKQLPMDPECKFRPDFYQETQASIMGHQWIHSIVDFCDVDVEEIAADLRHNKEAQNMQNRLCDQQSAWEVMRSHEDFTNGNNPSNPSISYTTPEFRVLRKSEKIRVLVFDVSGSMRETGSTGTQKVLEQAYAAYFVIDDIIETGSRLAMVEFHLEPHTLWNLTEVINEQTKISIKAVVPRIADGGTDIYKALQRAIDILDESQTPTNGTEIVLLSDGMSNFPYLHIIPDIVRRGIKVHTIAITDSADANMTTLSTQTGGKSFTYLQTTQISFADVLTQALQNQDEGELTPQQLLGTVYEVTPSSTDITGSFVIDEGIGNNTSVTVLLSSNQTIKLEVVGPDGTVYSLTEDGESAKLLVNANSQAPVGRYNFTIKLPSAFSGTAEIRALSSAASDDAEVIHVKTRLSSNTITYDTNVRIFVSVQKCKIPILNANVTLVLASSSSYTPTILQLSDGGTGADSFVDDGIYSAYLLHTYFTVDSYYNIKVYVQGDENTYYYNSNSATSRASSVSGNDESDATKKSVGIFERQAITEGITVENFQYNAADTIAPAQITDLRYERIVGTEATSTYTFVWTAVGSNLDIGQASAYDMRFNENIDDLRNSFLVSTVIPATMPTPQTSGITEILNVTFSLSDCSGTCFVAIRARDENNLIGSLSNIISIDIDFSYIFTKDIVPEEESKTSNVQLVIILVTVAFVVVLGIIILACAIKQYSGKNETKVKRISLKRNAPDTQETELREIRVSRDTPALGINGPWRQRFSDSQNIDMRNIERKPTMINEPWRQRVADSQNIDMRNIEMKPTAINGPWRQRFADSRNSDMRDIEMKPEVIIGPWKQRFADSQNIDMRNIERKPIRRKTLENLDF